MGKGWTGTHGEQSSPNSVAAMGQGRDCLWGDVETSCILSRTYSGLWGMHLGLLLRLQDMDHGKKALWPISMPTVPPELLGECFLQPPLP